MSVDPFEGAEVIFDRELAARFEVAPEEGLPLPIDELDAVIRDPSLVLLQEARTSPAAIDVKAHPFFARLPYLHQWGALNAETALNLADAHGYIELGRIRRILDFGAGRGGPTFALLQLADFNGGVVDAVDLYEEDAVGALRTHGYISDDHVHHGDGLDFLRNVSGADRYDLVTAFMFGPDTCGDLALGLLEASRHALRTGGYLVINSDPDTMTAVQSVLSAEGQTFELIPGESLEPTWLPDTVVVRPNH